MAEETPQPGNTENPPSPAPQQQTGQQPETQHSQERSGQRRNNRRVHPRRHGARQDHFRRDHQQSSRPPARENPSVPQGKDTDTDDEDETVQDRSAPQGRRHYRGRPPRKIIEEWANDPYCE